ncbi:hypothetical protein PCASD_08639 [Puccinia coronata f. sp. avenae]|uniref:Uncharacterized protein n=1 Tax=Puccinia coronata f. sp. avenae TaxID=200324 RepID=A0A2N5V7E6_9BASI|nr:hypothetical protein PCASD_08639 [Puccinia coronata f. sp. avenae]
MSSTSVSSNSAGNLTTQDDRELHNPTQQSTTCHGISDATSRLSPRDGHHSNMIDCGHQGLQNSPPPPGPHTHLHETDGTDVPPERLPTYGELKSQEGHRFGRWRGWIEKRARERIEERTIDREEAERQGRPFGTGWDLPQLNLSKNQSQLPPMNRNSSIISARDERAAFKSASRNHRDAFFKHQKGKFDGSTSSHRPNLEPGPGAVKLTPSTSIHQIGSRFLPQFASQPLCAIPLPLIKTRHHYPSTTEPPAERFLLVGTIDGLYVCDLMPSLSSTVKKDMVSPTDSKIYQLWQGLGVHQLEIAVEDTPHSTNTSVPGIVIALTSSSNESSTSPVGMDGVTKSIKMWPLQSMINLVKFRAFSESSECLDLHERPTNTKKTPSLTAGTSALAGFISMFEKGKHKAESSISTLSDTFSHTSTRPQSGGSYGHKPSPTSPFTKPSTLPASSTQKSSNQSHLDLPLQWAKQTISLNLPRIQAYGPILFIKLSNSPVPGFNPINDQLDQINDSQSIPSGLRPRSRARTDDGEDDSNALNDGWWYLIIATKQMIFVMESQPASQRTWHLCAEMSAPFTAKSAHLVLSEFPRSNHSRTASQSRASTLLSRRSHNPRLGYGELAVLLTMKEYAVVISLSDLSVRELDLQGTVTASQSTASISAYTSSLRPTTGSFSGLSNLERVQNNFKPFGRHTPPTTGSIEPVLINKRVKDGLGMARDEGFQVENRRLSRLVSDRRWAGCEELLIPVPITRGYLTYAVICPFGYEFRRRSSQREPSGSGIEQRAGLAGGLPPPLLLKPVHTFTWRAMPVKLQAQIIPTPRKWAKFQEKKELPGGAQSDQNSSSDEVFCCLTAFTASSVEVQEGFISLKFLRIMWETARFGHRPDPKLSFFTPASCAYRRRVRQASSSSYSSTQTTSSINDDENDQTARQPTLSRGAAIPISPQPPSNEPASSADQPFESGEDELNDNSSYDYSAKIGYLCNSAAWFSRTPSSQAQKDLQPSQPIHHLDRNPDSFGSSTSNATISAHDHPPQHEAQQQQSQNSHLGGRDFTQGSFFWKQAVGEWKIMYVCNSMDL